MIYSKDGTLGLRAIELEDLDIIQKWRNSESIRRYFREYREFSMEQKRDWYNKMIHDKRFEMFILEESSRQSLLGVAGLTYIDWVNKHADLHFYIGIDDKWIDKEYSPLGVSILLDYAYGILNLNKVWVEVYEIDKLKLDFFQSLGFKIDANLREHYFYKGKYYKSHILSLLKKEYYNE